MFSALNIWRGDRLERAKAYLHRNIRLQNLCNAKIDQISELRVLSTGVRSTTATGERIQSSMKVMDKTAEIICQIVDLEEQLKDDIQKLVTMKIEITNKINSLEDDEHVLILNLRYLNFKTWETIACEMGYTFQWVHKIHNQALNNFKAKYRA